MDKRRVLDDCFLTDKDRLRHNEALDLIRERLNPVASSETISIDDALSRIAAESIQAVRDIPLHDNAAVDGYAFAFSEYRQNDGSLNISTRIPAGKLETYQLGPGEAARIFTGASIPRGADTVAMQEDCEQTDDCIRVPPGLKAGANRRKAGEDLAIGDPVFNTGHRFIAQDIARLASLGKEQVSVFQSLKIALFSTGNELVQPNQAIKPGQVYDVNRPLLKSLMKDLPVAITDLGALPDDKARLHSQLSEAAKTHDVIISSGGVSRGEEDHMVTALESLGTCHMWQLAVKPGRPMAMGQIGDSLFLGLPGNPVAVMVCFLLYGRQMIIRLAGANWRLPHRYQIPAAFEIPRKKPDRREFYRGILKVMPDGKTCVDKFPEDGSGLIRSLTASDGLIEIDEEKTKIEVGDLVNFIPYPGF